MSFFLIQNYGLGQNQILQTGLIPSTGEEILSIPTNIYNEEEAYTQGIDSVDLTEKGMFPPHLKQDSTSACTAFALAYALKTFQEADENQCSVYNAYGEQIDSLIFSPSFLFKLIKKGENCTTPIKLPDALMALKRYGSVSIIDDPFIKRDLITDCKTPNEDLIRKGKPYRIASFYQLSDSKRINPEVFDGRKVGLIERIKDRLINFHPVIIGAYLNSQFENEDYELFDYKGVPIWTNHHYTSESYHAMLIVGYNNKLQAFKLYNSYGNYEFIWMKYNVFERLTNFDVYVAIDVAKRHQEYVNNEEPRIQNYDWEEFYISDEKLLTKGEVDMNVYEHSFIENRYYKLTVLGIDTNSEDIYLEFEDKSDSIFSNEIVLSRNNKQKFMWREKIFEFAYNNVDLNLASWSLEIKKNDSLNNANYALIYPIKLYDFNSCIDSNKLRCFNHVTAELQETGIFKISGIQTNYEVDSWNGGLNFEILDATKTVIFMIKSPSYFQNGTLDNLGNRIDNIRVFETIVQYNDVLQKARYLRASVFTD